MAVTKPSDPGIDIVPVTPSDDTDLTGGLCRALYIGASGTLRVLTANEQVRTVTVLPGVLPVQVKRVYATGTTAASISAIY